MAEFLFEPVPHAEAIAFIQAKPAVTRDVFNRLLPELKARAFTITGVETATVLQDVRDRLADLPAGGDWDKIKHDIADTISPWLDDSSKSEAENMAAAEARAEILLRIHGFQAYSAARERVIERQADVFPYCQYVTVGDDRVRPAHAALDGIVLPTNHPFWQTHTPPWDWGCRCEKVPLSDADAADVRAEDAGKPVDDQRIIEGARLRKLDEEGALVRGPNQITDVRAPIEKATTPAERAAAYTWNPGDLRLPLDQLQARYDATTWSQFEGWAKQQHIEELGQSVWDWLAKIPAAETPATAAMPVAALVPQGKAVSAALDSQLRGSQATKARTALNLIDAVHGDGDLPPIPIAGTAKRTQVGGYAFERYTGKPIRIELSRYAPDPEMTLLHEVGHFLDHQTLGLRSQNASEYHATLAKWREAVRATEPVRTLKDWSAQSHITVTLPDGSTVQRLINQKYVQYLLRDREIFARSYAQYIATKTGDPTLLDQLKNIRTGGNAITQWNDAEFRPIMAALDDVFRGLGWMK